MSSTLLDDPEFRRLPSGVAGLDTILCGGLLAGSVYIIGGGPGAGKTILANQVCFSAAAQGERTLYVTLLAESHHRLVRNLRRLRFFSESKAADAVVFESAFEALKQEGLDGVLRFLTRNGKRQRASLLVLDGLFALEDTAQSEAELREFINDLSALADLTGCTILLLTNSERGRGSPEYTMVDGWLELDSRIESGRLSRFLRVNKFRGSNFIGGYHQLQISDEGVAVFPRLEALEAEPVAPEAIAGLLSSGAASIDRALGGGIAKASTTLVAGPSGIGKTSFGLQFICASSEREPGLVLSFYEDAPRLCRRARSLGLDLEAKLASGIVQMIWVSATEKILDIIASQLLNAIARNGTRRLLIDGLQGFRQACQQPERLDAFLAVLTDRLRSLGVTSTFTIEVPELHQAPAALAVHGLSAVAENILLLRYQRQHGILRRVLEVIKVRESTFDPHLFELSLSDRGLSIDYLPDAEPNTRYHGAPAGGDATDG